MRALKDRYGFLFWLRWIGSFAGSFVLSAVAWTAVFTRVFGRIEGEEVMVSWTVSVFGTWFLLVIPFMRKKEQIWKRLNTDQEKSVDAWFTGFGSFLTAFIACSFIWTFMLRSQLTPNVRGFDPLWMKAVFGSWLVILVPLLVWMYRSADSIFRIAHDRQTRPPSFRALWVEPSKRLLSPRLAEKLKKAKPTLPGGHLVRSRLVSGEILPLYVQNGREVVGAYGFHADRFDASSVQEIELWDLSQAPVFDESEWVRFNYST